MAAVRGAWSKSVEEIFINAMAAVRREKDQENQKALFANREELMNRFLEHARTSYVIRAGTIEGEEAETVLRRRLSKIPEPEFRLLCSYALTDGMSAEGRWFSDVGGECKPPCETEAT